MRLRCRSVQQYLSDYIDCGLTSRRNAMVKNHLRHCSACRYEFESLRRTTGLLSYYVEPEVPKGYHNRFWRELQFTIEQAESQPRWWTGTGLWQSVSSTGQSFLDQFAYSCRTLIDASNQWLLKWGKSVPVYSVILIGMSALFVADRLMQTPEEFQRLGARQLRSPLEEEPVRLVRTQENRELIAKREKVPGLPQGLSNQERHAPKKMNHQLKLADVPNQDWDSNDYAPFEGNSETLRAQIDDSDVFPYLIASAQLSNPDSALTTREFSGMVAIDSPFPDKFEREGRQSNSSLRVLKHVAVRDLSLTEVYDSVKL